MQGMFRGECLHANLWVNNLNIAYVEAYLVTQQRPNFLTDNVLHCLILQ